MAYIDLDEINRLHPKLTAKYPLSFANGISAAISEINKLPNAAVVPKSEVEEWVDRCRDWHEVGKLKCQEIERLHGILLQFTDVVHKWGAKNNIDTSEISLVPILQEEADSIIKKANQELASEIFAEIDSKILAEIDLCNGVLIEFEEADEPYHRIKGEVSALCKIQDFIAELKKKYTEGTK